MQVILYKILMLDVEKILYCTVETKKYNNLGKLFNDKFFSLKSVGGIDSG